LVCICIIITTTTIMKRNHDVIEGEEKAHRSGLLLTRVNLF